MKITDIVDNIISKVNVTTTHKNTTGNPHGTTFSDIVSKPTTVSGYGLTDVYTKTESNTSLALKVNSSEKGVANGVATLDVNGKVVLTQIPDSVLGQLEYMGTWNFTTIPTATQKGQYWIASVSGNGYIVGDWAVWNGSAFDKVDNTDAVATVAGRTGNVVLTKSDVGLANADNTADSAKNVLSASKWTTARTLSLAGDVTGSASIDGSGNVTLTATVVDDSHNHVIENIDGLQTALDAIDATAELNSNMMTKAQFNALAEERKANRAGSGFDEWGKHSNLIGYPNVNEGMWTIPVSPPIANTFFIGASSNPANDAGTSKTRYSLANINGVKCNLSYINVANAPRAEILLPTAPTIYPHDTVLTAEQIASGVIKHADASNSGLIVNGKFDTDTSGWIANNALLTVDSGKLVVSDNGTYSAAKQVFSTIVGKKYIFEFEVTNNVDGTYLYGVHNSATWDGAGATGNVYSADQIISTIGSTRKEVSFVAGSTTTMIIVGQVGTTPCSFDNIAVYPADAISRSDLVFLESWHEDISEKNFVYPLGNVQYLGGNSDGLTGIANGAFSGFETYSVFGNWQTSSALIGKGYVWSSLNEAQKKSFISNPENNCYLDGDKVIQVRYRVRVVQGWGDSWNSVNAISDLSLNYSPSGVAYPKPKGKLVSIPRDIQNANTEGNTGYFTTPKNIFMVNTGDIGAFSAISKTNTLDTTIAYDGKCFALPIALVHRRNQGAYHPVYNPNGTKPLWSIDGADAGKRWFESTAVKPLSTANCVDFGNTRVSGDYSPFVHLASYGKIGTDTGRPDGLFYDQIHEGDILDLRNSSKKVEDYNRLISREFNKLVAGTNRGKEGENTLYYKNITGNNLSVIMATSIGNQPPTSIDRDTYFVINNSSSAIQIAYWTGSSATGYIQVNSGASSNIEVPFGASLYIQGNNGTTVTTVNVTVVRVKGSRNSTTRTKSNTLLHCDIIGNPTNYPTAWKQSGVSGTPLIVAEDGTSLLPNGTLDTFKLSRKANATPLLCLRSTDNGTTWSSFTPTFSTSTNAITLTDEPATNLVMVYYQTHTSMAVPVASSEVLEIGDVVGTNGLYNAHLVSTLINKTPVKASAPYLQMGYSVDSYRLSMITFAFSGLVEELPKHDALTLAGGAVGVPAVKVFPYLTRLNGKAYLNLVFKEMKHNGTSWGDDTKFNIVDNVSITTDFYGQTVLIGQKTVELPYFIEKGE